MSLFPRNLYRAEQVRNLDRMAMERLGVPGQALMARAGRAAFDELRRRWPRARRIAVCCGAGNNGGDGWVVARLAHAAGLAVQVLAVVAVERLQGEARAAADAALAAGVPWRPWAGETLEGFELVVDALVGTGLNGPVREPCLAAINTINHSGLPVLALDVPSGLHADTGQPLGAAVCAQATLTFVGLKQGLFTGQARDYVGQVLLDDLELPSELYGEVPVAARLLDRSLLSTLKPRPRSAHKGQFGHVLVIGGEIGMAGAIRMAAEAAARVGAGLVSVATRRSHADLISAARPELMCNGVERAEELKPLLDRASVVVIGPGLGSGEWGRALFARVLESQRPLVLDADALGLLAADVCRREQWVLTPHPGEAARLLGCGIADIEADRFAAAAAIQASYAGTVVLKGAGTLVTDKQGRTDVCALGNPGMAGGGMGDVLAGVIGSLLGQGLEQGEAARVGVCLHAAAGDEAARQGERGLLATDLLPELRRLANP